MRAKEIEIYLRDLRELRDPPYSWALLDLIAAHIVRVFELSEPPLGREFFSTGAAGEIERSTLAVLKARAAQIEASSDKQVQEGLAKLKAYYATDPGPPSEPPKVWSEP